MKDFLKINSVAIFTKILGAIFSLLSIFFLTRVLDKSEYGKYVLLSSTVNIFSVIFFQWLAVVASRYLTMNPKYISFYIKNNLLLISSILFFLIFSLSFLFNDSQFWIIGITSISFGIYNVKLQIENSLESWRSYNLLLLSKYIATFVFLLLFLYFFKSAIFAILALFIGTIISILINKKSFDNFNFNEKIEINLFKFGVTYTIILILNSLIDFADRFLIKYFKGYFSVGQYSANYDLIQQTFGGVLGVFAIYFTPKILKSKNQNSLLSFDKLNKRYLNFSLICGSFLALNFFIAYPIISMVISEKYRYITFFEEFFILFGIFIGIIKGTIFDLNLQIEGRFKILIYNMLIMAFVNFFLNIFLIPKYDQLGAAFATFITFLIGLSISIYFSLRYIKVYNYIISDLIKLIVITFTFLYLNSTFMSNSNLYIIFKNIFFTMFFFILIFFMNLFGSRSYFKLVKKNLLNF